MMRIAVPNKGALAEVASTILKEAGYATRRDSKALNVIDRANNVEFFFLRPKDIAIYVASGELDLGITGRDLAADSQAEVTEVLALGFGSSTFRFAAPVGEHQDLSTLEGTRIATSYENLVSDHLAGHGVSAEVVHLDGAVESSIRLGVADVIADVVETGTTLRQAGLEPFGDPIMTSEAVLFSRPGLELSDDAAHALEVLERRIRGVLVAREYVLLDYDVPTALLDRAVTITPGFQSPTVSPLHGGEWSAVRSMVEKAHAHRMMDELYEAGARAILVTAIQACRI